MHASRLTILMLVLVACGPQSAAGTGTDDESANLAPAPGGSGGFGSGGHGGGAAEGPSGSGGATSAPSGPHPTSGASGGANTGSGGSNGPAMTPALDAGMPMTAADGAVAPSCDAAQAGNCGCADLESHPFGCGFAWGTNDSGGALDSYGYLQFMSKWVGYEVQADGTLPSCDGCTWLSQQVAPTELVPVYYAYFIGYFGHANGYADGNENPNGPNLTTDAAQLIRDHRQALIDMYSWYAKKSYEVWKTRPIVWLLEGDFVQYSGDTQKNKLSYTELGQLAADITCAIKSNMPNAVVAINHSTWNSDQVTNDFWNAMKNVAYDLVWTTGVPNNAGFLEKSATPDAYNHATATYAYVHGFTGRPIFVDTSFGLSAMEDAWSSADAATLNARIADGVIAANVTSAPASYASAIATLAPQLDATCR
jgi:hypothetical protein